MFVLSLKEIIIITIITPEIVFDTEYIAFSVYFPIISVSSVVEYNTTTDHSDQTDLSLGPLVPWSLIMFFCLKQLYVLLLLCLILSSFV